jgi:hypothetical protein
VCDIDAERDQTVIKNLEWLRPLGVTGSVRAIARSCRIVHANHKLREVTLESRKGRPDLTVSLDAQGAVTGSFTSH